MAAYVETGNGAEAVRLAEQLRRHVPDAIGAVTQPGRHLYPERPEDKAIAVYELTRAAGQLTEASEYRNLMLLYWAPRTGTEGDRGDQRRPGEGHPARTHETYSLLGQAYYFSDQMDPATRLTGGALLAPDGEAYLNLPRPLWAEGRIPEAKQAAQQASTKGSSRPRTRRPSRQTVTIVAGRARRGWCVPAGLV